MLHNLFAAFDTLNKLYFAECITSLLLLMVPWFFRRRIGALPALAWSYFIARQIWSVFTPWFHVTYGYQLQNVMQVAEAQALIQIVVYPAIIFSLPPIDWKKYWTIFMLFDFSIILFGSKGILTGVSFEPGVFAIMSPWFMSLALGSTYIGAMVFGSSMLILTLFWIIWQKSMTGIMVLAVCVLAWIWKNRWRHSWQNFILLIMVVGLGAVGVAFIISHNKDFSSINPRYDAWNLHMHFWWDKIDHFFGQGLGSYQWTAPFLMVKKWAYISLHNDYLQILFETGFLGLSAFLLICSSILWRSLRSPVLFPMVVGALTFMWSYYPLHVGFTQIMFLFLVKEVTDDKR